MPLPEGLVFDIQRFCPGDGPGLRTTVFLKGCPLRCRWCHNPESQSFEPEELFNASLCLHCGRCAEGCPAEARRIAGRWLSVDAVLEKVLADRGFYGDEGGLTLSGGEPLSRPDFAAALLAAARAEGIRTAVETSLHAPAPVVEKLRPLVDLWLVDLKAGRADHRRLTGVDRDLIDANRALLAPGSFILRIPALAENMTPEFLAEIPAAARGARSVELLPGHDLGASKSERLGRPPTEAVRPPPDLPGIRDALAPRLAVPLSIEGEAGAFRRIDYRSDLDGHADWYYLSPGVERAGGGGRDGGVDAVVALHGHGSRGDQLFSRADMRPWLDALRERGVGVLAPNLRDNAWMNPAAVHDLARLVTKEKARNDWRRVFIVAGSMGGTGALIFAMRHPELVAGVAALGAATSIGGYRAWCAARAGEGPAVLREIEAAIAVHHRPEDYPRHDVLANAGRLTMPVLLYHGGADAIIPVTEARALSARLADKKDFRYHEIPDGNHDAPLPYFTEALERLLGVPGN